MMFLLTLDVIDNHIFVALAVAETSIFMTPTSKIREMMVRFDMCETQCGNKMWCNS